MRNLRLLLAVAIVVTSASGCAMALLGVAFHGAYLPHDVYIFEPKASWGVPSAHGGCPGGSPSIRLSASNPEWLKIEVGIWDSVQAKNRRFKDPTLFISFYKGWHLSIRVQERRRKTPVFVRASSPYIHVTLSDGTSRRINVPELANEFVLVGHAWNVGDGKTINVVLDGVPPQDLIITIPDFVVNGTPVAAGNVAFTYRKHTRFGGC